MGVSLFRRQCPQPAEEQPYRVSAEITDKRTGRGVFIDVKKMKIETDFNRIIKECFWDLNISAEEIRNILSASDHRSKAFLFEKILANSTKLLSDLQLFDKNTLKTMLEEYKPGQYNHDYLFRRKNIAQVYFFDEPVLIDELKWQI